MTVSSTLDKNFYTASGSQTDFAYGFKIYNSSEMRVVTRDNDTGVETVEDPNDYTVTGMGLDNGGTVAFDSAPTADHIILLRRFTSLIQNSDIRNQESYRPADIETALDTLLFQVQRVQYDIDRSIRLMESEAATADLTVLPTLQVRKGNILGFNLSTGAIEMFAVVTVTGLHAVNHQNGGSDEINLAGMSGELATLQPPKLHAAAHQPGAGDEVIHAAAHQSGGGDAIKLDNLAAPEDNTDLDATTGLHGLLPKLGSGTVNYFRADGTWADPKGNTIVTKTTTYTATVNDDIILCNANGGAWTLSLFRASDAPGKSLTIIKTDSSVNMLTVDGFGSDEIFGKLTIKLSGLRDVVKIVSDGADWVATSPEYEYRTVAARCKGGGGGVTIEKEVGAWISAENRTAVGNYDITIRTGIFSSEPNVLLSCDGDTRDNSELMLMAWLKGSQLSATKIEWYTQDWKDGVGLQTSDNVDVELIVRGPR